MSENDLKELGRKISLDLGLTDYYYQKEDGGWYKANKVEFFNHFFHEQIKRKTVPKEFRKIWKQRISQQFPHLTDSSVKATEQSPANLPVSTRQERSNNPTKKSDDADHQSSSDPNPKNIAQSPKRNNLASKSAKKVSPSIEQIMEQPCSSSSIKTRSITDKNIHEDIDVGQGSKNRKSRRIEKAGQNISDENNSLDQNISMTAPTPPKHVLKGDIDRIRNHYSNSKVHDGMAKIAKEWQNKEEADDKIIALKYGHKINGPVETLDAPCRKLKISFLKIEDLFKAGFIDDMPILNIRKFMTALNEERVPLFDGFLNYNVLNKEPY